MRKKASSPTLIVCAACLVVLCGLGGGLLPAVSSGIAMIMTLAYALLAGRIPAPRMPRRIPSPHAVFLVLLLFLVVSVVPLPRPLAALAGSPRAAQNARVAEALEQAATLDVSDAAHPWFSLTRNRAGTLKLIAIALSVFAGAMLAASLDTRDKRILLGTMTALGGAVAAAGLVSLTVRPQGDTLWWIFPTSHHLPGPLGGFVNRNHYAGFLALLTPVALGTAVSAFRARRLIAGLLAGGACALTIGTTLATLSRGATIACAAGLITAAVPLLRRHTREAVLATVLLAATAAFAVHRMPTEPIAQRLRTLEDPVHTQSGQTRLSAWRDAMSIWRTYPLMGAGPDAFRFVYPQFRRTSAREFMTHPENEYVQTLADTGLAGLLLLAAFVVSLLGTARAHPVDDDILPAAARGALVAAATHACLDFPLHIPVYAMAAGLCAGLTVQLPAAAIADFLNVTRTPRFTPAALLVPALPAVAAVILALDLLLGLHKWDNRGFIERAGANDLTRTLAWSPTAWQAWYYLGRQACLLRTDPGRRFGEQCLTWAAEYDPNNYGIWLALGNLRLALGDRSGAREAFARVKALREWVVVPTVPDVPEGG